MSYGYNEGLILNKFCIGLCYYKTLQCSAKTLFFLPSDSLNSFNLAVSHAIDLCRDKWLFNQFKWYLQTDCCSLQGYRHGQIFMSMAWEGLIILTFFLLLFNFNPWHSIYWKCPLSSSQYYWALKFFQSAWILQRWVEPSLLVDSCALILFYSILIPSCRDSRWV